MDELQRQYARMQETIDGIREVAESYLRMADENRELLELQGERRSDRNRPNRLPSYSEQKAMRTAKMNTDFDPTVAGSEDDTTVVFDGSVTLDLDEPREVCPGTEVSRGRYEQRLIKTLEGLRAEVRRYDELRAYVSPSARGENLRRLRKSLDLVRKVQTLLNRTGSWSFLFAEGS